MVQPPVWYCTQQTFWRSAVEKEESNMATTAVSPVKLKTGWMLQIRYYYSLVIGLHQQRVYTSFLFTMHTSYIYCYLLMSDIKFISTHFLFIIPFTLTSIFFQTTLSHFLSCMIFISYIWYSLYLIQHTNLQEKCDIRHFFS